MNDREFLLNQSRAMADAQIYDGINQRPFEVQRLEFDLSNARLESDPYVISTAFRSFFVRDASDTATSVNFRVISQDSIQASVPLRINDSMDFGRPIPKAFLHWDAQPGKKIVLLIFYSSSFRSGMQISQNAGGISINEGSSASGPIAVTLAAATATIIAPAKLDRKTTTIENKTGADLFIAGDNTVSNAGATEGIKVADGGFIRWRNTSALYGYSVAGGKVTRVEEA